MQEIVSCSGNASTGVRVVEVQEDTSVSVGCHRPSVRIERWLADD